jgi:hypothetical protein
MTLKASFNPVAFRASSNIMRQKGHAVMRISAPVATDGHWTSPTHDFHEIVATPEKLKCTLRRFDYNPISSIARALLSNFIYLSRL